MFKEKTKTYNRKGKQAKNDFKPNPFCDKNHLMFIFLNHIITVTMNVTLSLEKLKSLTSSYNHQHSQKFPLHFPQMKNKRK